MKKNEDLKELPFLWGVTHIAPQVESSCISSDWYYAASSGRVPAIGRGVAYLEDYMKHHEHLEALGCNAFRVCLEWARIEPEEGVFDRAALCTYREILKDLRQRKIKTVVGLFHWSLPVWFATAYGLHHKDTREKFHGFVQKVSHELGDLIDMVVVFNEPMVYIGTGYLLGERLPYRKNIFLAYLVKRNLVGMHRDSYDLWKASYPGALVGSTHLWNDIRARDEKNILLKSMLSLAQKVSEYFRVHHIINQTKDKSDYIGVNYYLKNSFFLGTKDGKWGVHTTNDWHDPDVWHHYVEGFSPILERAAQYDLPLYVMENGKPSNIGIDDLDRQKFLNDHLAVLMQKRVHLPIKGYFHHSFMDCYEWNSGYDFKFGLIAVDRDTLELRRRKSFFQYRDIIENDLSHK